MGFWGSKLIGQPVRIQGIAFRNFENIDASQTPNIQPVESVFNSVLL
jgi:hypothetical protein